MPIAATLPLLTVLVGTARPFLYATAFRSGHALGMGVYLLLYHRRRLIDGPTMRLATRRLFSWTMTFWDLETFSLAPFAYATRMIAVSAATVIYNVWPITIVLLTT